MRTKKNKRVGKETSEKQSQTSREAGVFSFYKYKPVTRLIRRIKWKNIKTIEVKEEISTQHGHFKNVIIIIVWVWMFCLRVSLCSTRKLGAYRS